jgi:hypothetical protein
VSEPPIPAAPADLELIAQLKSQLQYAELRIRVLEERLRLMRIESTEQAAKNYPTRKWNCSNLSPSSAKS